MAKNKKFEEYNRGRMQGLDMAYRILRDAGQKEAAALIGEEIRMRGKMPVPLPVTSKEVIHGLEPIKKCMYETTLCMTIMTLHDQFGFGKKRCQDFIRRWNLKTDCLATEMFNWADYVQAVKDEIGIDLPAEAMKVEGLV